ncbi:MAG: LytTR family transcriptional regulator [Gammaproteobacteria bacterium]|nr:LytTR family transcriptional regulator [Gammaproteobacteria bacterium]
MLWFKNPSLNSNYQPLLLLNYGAWLSFFLVYLLYAFFWRHFADNTEIQYSLTTSLHWFFKEWLAWLILSPFMLGYLVLSKRSVFNKLLVAILTSLLVSLCLRGLLTSQEYSANALAAMLFVLPKYIPTALAIAAGWYVFERRQASSDVLEEHPKNPEVLLESNGLKFNVSLSDILYLNSAGNYVEIVTNKQSYIQRSTFKQFLQSLPSNMFVQVHRSYAVNIQHLVKLSNNDNGSAVATLINQQKIPVSKNYKNKVKSLAISN